MPARVQIVVEAKDATAGVFRAITSELGAFGGMVEELTAKNVNWGNVTNMAAKMVIDGLKESIRATTEYAAEVRDLSLASGQSAEQSSRMLQVLDDYQLSADDAKTATRALTKEGLAPTIDTIAKLSGEYLKLTSVEERNAFVQKNLGRAGQEWLNLLNQGPDAIRKMNAAVSDNLILTDENIKQAEEYRLALDAWGDAVEGVQIAMGTKLLPAMTGVLDETNNTVTAIQIMSDQGMSWYDILDNMALNTVVYTDALKQAAEGTTELTTAQDTAIQSATELEAAQKAAAEATKAIDAANRSFIGTLGNVASARETLNKGMAETDAAFAAGNITLDEHKAKMGELKATYDDTLNSMVLGLIQFKLAADGAFDDADLNTYLAAGVKLGQWSQGMVTETKKLYNEATNMATGLDHAGDIIYHTGKRAVDASVDLGIMADGAIALESAVRPAVAAVSGLKSQLNGLPVSGSAWQYDFVINVQGQVPHIATATYTTAGGYNTNVHPGGGGTQQGGEVFAGVPTTVGEAGQETFVPSSNGRIIGHREALHQAGLMGGGSQRNIFYGPVTLQIGEDSAAGFMSIR